MRLFLARVALAGATAHVVGTATSLAASTLRSRSYKDLPRADAATTARVLPVITALYAGAAPEGAWMTDGAVFEDAAVRCEGKAEVLEAFRALRVLGPKSLEPPTVHAGPTRDTVFVRQRQSYLSGALCVSSTVLIRVEEDGRFSHMEEQWNDVPLLMPLGLSRRLNGVLSYFITSALVP